MINNNPINAIDGARKRSMGMIEGASDAFFLWAGRVWFIEFKTESGKQSPAQKTWQLIVESQGFTYVVIRSVEQFQELFRNIIN
jgi:hypothetical protein